MKKSTLVLALVAFFASFLAVPASGQMDQYTLLATAAQAVITAADTANTVTETSARPGRGYVIHVKKETIREDFAGETSYKIYCYFWLYKKDKVLTWKTSTLVFPWSEKKLFDTALIEGVGRKLKNREREAVKEAIISLVHKRDL